MKKLIYLIPILLLLSGCSFALFSTVEPPEQKGNIITLDGFTFEKKEMPIRDWTARTDVFEVNENGCLVMEGNCWVSNTYYESHMKILTNIDTCKYRYVKFNSSLDSIAFRQEMTPSSQIWINGFKYSSHARDNITREKHLHNLNIYSDGDRMSYVWDEADEPGFDTMCGLIEIIVRCAADQNATAYAGLKICGIETKER